ncbi:mitochondrial import receptor subunit TOM40B isoform X4 [Oenanthe melanoleuca]|uniref:mitochondrial import receptor subunit TOM40B isoform X4 n=1 Tax=Oenanthe melanoleuca TaxID=2939378 RepID=UPI0024C1CE70|nr:mitochondrial import receptor subunit TOM40B isoform X4 [Oenanthe melanoleuca]
MGDMGTAQGTRGGGGDRGGAGRGQRAEEMGTEGTWRGTQGGDRDVPPWGMRGSRDAGRGHQGGVGTAWGGDMGHAGGDKGWGRWHRREHGVGGVQGCRDGGHGCHRTRGTARVWGQESGAERARRGTSPLGCGAPEGPHSGAAPPSPLSQWAARVARGQDGGGAPPEGAPGGAARDGGGPRRPVGAMGSAGSRAPRRAQPRGNPGSFDELHRLCKEVFPPQMEGVKLIVTKTLSSHFQVTHTVHMSTLGPSGYRFNATYVGDRQLGPAEVFPTLLGDMDSAGSLNAQALQLLGERLRAKAVFQFDGEYRGDDCTATLTLGNPDVLGGSERHRPPGAGRGARLPPAPRRGGGHPHAGRQIFGPRLGDHAQRGLRGGSRQLLPPGQRAGAGGGGAGGQHAAAGDHLCLRLPAQPAASQRRLQRAPGQ